MYNQNITPEEIVDYLNALLGMSPFNGLINQDKNNKDLIKIDANEDTRRINRFYLDKE